MCTQYWYNLKILTCNSLVSNTLTDYEIGKLHVRKGVIWRLWPVGQMKNQNALCSPAYRRYHKQAAYQVGIPCMFYYGLKCYKAHDSTHVQHTFNISLFCIWDTDFCNRGACMTMCVLICIEFDYSIVSLLFLFLNTTLYSIYRGRFLTVNFSDIYMYTIYMQWPQTVQTVVN